MAMAPLSQVSQLSLLLLVAGLCLTCGVFPVQGAGTVASLYNTTNGVTNKTNIVTVAPSLLTGPSASSLGCTNLPSGFVPLSGLFKWNATAGSSACSWFVFFTLPACAKSGDGSESGVKSSVNDTAIPDFSASRFQANATRAKSVSCGYDVNPCLRQPCSDPNALCTSSSIIAKLESNSSTVSLFTTRSCNACKTGLVKVNGLCVDPCASMVCPPPATCALNASNGAFCMCPDDFAWNPTMKQCDNVGPQRWLDALNPVRAQYGCSPLTWNTTMASLALSAATGANTTQCPAFLRDTTLPSFSSPTYNKTGTAKTGMSENDAFQRGSQQQRDAVDLWMNSNKLANAARINSTKTTQVGCAKTYCSAGTFLICLFWPFTF